MSSYASYCQDQAAVCARRARLAGSPEIVAYCRSLELRWRRLAEQAKETGGALRHKSNPVAMLPLRDKPATSPVKYRKQTRERVAEPHSLFDTVSCKACSLAEQMDYPEAKRTMLNNADGYERLAERPEERAEGRWPQSK
jgi:hypothetical protein